MKWYGPLVVLVLASGVSGQQIPSVPCLRAGGEGIVHVKPDQAKIDIGVVTQAPTAQTAASQNAAQLEAVLGKLRVALGQSADIKTAGYSLNPVYTYSQNGKPPAIDGYRAVNTVEVTIDDLSTVGKAIDTATQGGANEIQSLQFTLKNSASARAEALRKAVLDARAKVDAMAAAMGVKPGKVILLEENGSTPVRPIMGEMRAQVASVTPVQPDTVDVRADVTLTVQIQ